MGNQAASVDRARARARAQEWTLQRILNELESIDPYDLVFRRSCEAIRETLVPALFDATRERGPLGQLNAGLLLLHLGEMRGTDGIIACLRSGDTELRVRALIRLSLLPLRQPGDDKTRRLETPVPLDEERIFAELRPLLTQPTTREGKLALEVMVKLNLPEAADLLHPLISHPDSEVRTRVLGWLAHRGEADGAMQAAEELLFGSPHSADADYWVISALETYCHGSQRDLALRAAELLGRYIATYGDRPDNMTANLVWRSLEGIAKARLPDERRVLEMVLSSSAGDWRQGIALVRLAHLDGAASIDRLRVALQDPQLRKHAAEGLAVAAKGLGDDLLIEALIDLIRAETRPEVLGELANAAVSVAGAVPPALERLATRLAPHDAMRIDWLKRGLTPRIAERRLVQAGAIRAPGEDTMREIEAHWELTRRPYSTVLDLLASDGRLTGFDCETSEMPINYVGLINDLLSISRDAFAPEAISQVVDDQTGESEVQFVYSGRAYAFTARDFGSWYDAHAVINGLNAALRDAGRKERFVSLYTGDQTCIVTFVPEAEFLAAAAELRLPLDSDPGW